MEKKNTIPDTAEQHDKIKHADSRRRFLKKAAYAAPKIVALGYLTRPLKGLADGSDAINNDKHLGHPDDFWK